MSGDDAPRRMDRANGGQQRQDGFSAHAFLQQEQQYPSWRNNAAIPPHHVQQQQQQNPQQQDYNNFYYSSGFTQFSGAGSGSANSDMRDSIAAIWSRTSPSAGGDAFSSGYGQFAAPPPHPHDSTGQFAANLTQPGHFPASDLSVFGGEYAAAAAAYGQQYNYGGGVPTSSAGGQGQGQGQYTQWGENGNGDRGYSYLGVHPGNGETGRVSEVQHGLEAMKITKKGEGSNGFHGGPKKMSWASVASQPAKPTPITTKTKKPGVLPPPAIIPSAKPPVQTPTIPPPTNIVSSPPETPNMTSAELPPPLDQPPPNHHEVMRGPPPTHVQRERPPPQHEGPPPMPHGGSRGNRVSNGMPPHSSGPIAIDSERPQLSPEGSPNNHPLLETLRSSNDYNPRNFDLNPKNARFFVIKSFSEDDIHRSIKYEIWCSTDHGNKRLDAAFKERNGKGPIYLLFSVNGSGHFCGMASMLSGVDYNNASSVWVQDKFKGQFKVKWIYIKDVPNTQLRQIRLENNENKPVTNSRDTQEVPPEKGKMVLKIMHGYKHQTSIFDDFIHYEKRQEEEEGKKAGMNMHSGHQDRYHERGGYHDKGGYHQDRGYHHHEGHNNRDERGGGHRRMDGGDRRRNPHNNYNPRH